jgi:DNA-binding response OmpR family regulator
VAPVVTAGDLTIDLVRRLVIRAGEALHLTPKAYCASISASCGRG